MKGLILKRCWELQHSQKLGGMSLLPTLVTPKQNHVSREGAHRLLLSLCPLANMQPLLSCAGTTRGDLQVPVHWHRGSIQLSNIQLVH